MWSKHIEMKKFLFLTLLFLASGLIYGQIPTYYLNPNKKLTQYNFKNWTTENGLPSNSLLHIHQTSDGYLWISGYSGLIRFDGNSFTVFNSSNTEALENNVIRSLAEDRKGNLWMTTQGSGLIAYNNGTFKTYGKEIGMMNLYRALLVDDKDRIWSASPEFGWFYLENEELHFIEHSSSLKNLEVRTIIQSQDGTIWFGTLGNGIYKYQNNQLSQVEMPDYLKNEWIYSLLSENGELWIGANSGVFTYNGKQFSRQLPQINSTVNDILRDKYGNMWFGTINGLYRKNKSDESLEYISTDNGLANNFVIDFLFDFEGNFWITQYKGGLTRISDGKFTNFTYRGGLPEKVVNAIDEISPNTLLVGFDEGNLVTIKNGQIYPYKPKTNLSRDRIRHILTDSKKNIWISTYDGLLKIEPSGKETFLNENTGFPESKIRLAYEDLNGNIWIGTRNNGLIRMDKNGKTQLYNVNHGLTSNLVMAINEDKQGNIWIGTSEAINGLNKISPDGRIEPIGPESGFFGEIVFNIYCDKDGLLWIASNNGLWLRKEDKFFSFNSKKGLLSDSPYDVIEDDYGFLWLPFSEGIMKVSKKELIEVRDFPEMKIHCTTFDKHDGMKQSECNPTTQSIKSQDGKLYFPTLDGIAMIDPLNMMYNNYIPPVYIESIKVDNTILPATSNLKINPGAKRYTFYYTAPCLYDGEKVKFKYRLTGFENEWTETENIRSVSYTNLKHGDYTFEVTASNNDNIWNEQGTKYSFSIKPRFIETAWFYILIGLVLISITYLFYRIRVIQLEKQKQELEEIVNERTHEILKKNSELEEQKNLIEQKSNILLEQKNEIEAQATVLEAQKEELKGLVASKDKIFSIISHDLRAPLGNIKNMIDMLTEHPERFDEEKRNKIFSNFSSITKSTFYLIDNLLNWTRAQRGLIVYDPEVILIQPIIEDILELFKPIYTKKNIFVANNIDSATLAFGDLNMVRTIFRNLISNALKFTPNEGRVEISSTVNSDTVEFSVKDNGIGMSPENLDNFLKSKDMNTTYGTNNEKGSGLGLILCRDFIEKNGGTFKVESHEGEGTKFSFTLKRFQI